MDNLSNENIIHKNKDSIEYIQFKRLLDYPEIEHCYTLRKANLNFRTTDENNIKEESYIKICNTLKLDKNSITSPHQTHTDRVEEVKDASQKFDEVDGVITNKKNIVLSTSSADCTSLLFYDPVKKVIGNVHSGWRGTLQKIGLKAVKKMISKYNCDPKDIICCICPHIRKCHFEVEEDVMKLFEQEFSNTIKIDDIIEKTRVVNGIQKYNIDTTTINKLMLKEVGLLEENIIDSQICTVCNSDKFHSYRTDKEWSGRNVAIITLK